MATTSRRAWQRFLGKGVVGRRFALVAAAAVLIAPGAARASQQMLVGAAEDAAKQPTLALAKAQMDLAALAGLDAIRLTSVWTSGETVPSTAELTGLRNAVDAADLDGIAVFLSVYPYGSSATPRTAEQQLEFASFAASLATALPTVHRFLIGNEPNLNRFWMPQFARNGRDLAAPAYETTLAKTYDALKAVSPSNVVIGGTVSPRGSDRPKGGRPTHSPTAFIADLGRAYRKSGRTLPIMDAFSLHPYEDNSAIPPTFAHPRSTSIALADYRKLVRLLGKAFDGTAQLGTALPIVYDEFGVQSRIPSLKRTLYAGRKPSSARPVAEATQAFYYASALGLAACQPTVSAYLIFHLRDESNLDRWQSGLYYTDNTPKSSLSIVKSAIDSFLTTGVHPCTVASVKEFARSAIANGSG